MKKTTPEIRNEGTETLTVLQQNGNYSGHTFFDFQFVESSRVATINDTALEILKSNAEFSSIQIQHNLDLVNVEIYKLRNTDVKAYMIPVHTASKEECIMAIHRNNKLFFFKTLIYVLPNANQKFELQSIDGQPYYTLEINRENKVGNISFFKEVNLKENVVPDDGILHNYRKEPPWWRSRLGGARWLMLLMSVILWNNGHPV